MVTVEGTSEPYMKGNVGGTKADVLEESKDKGYKF